MIPNNNPTSLPGRVVGCLDGYYTVRLDNGETVRCRPRGVFRKDGFAVAVGDRVSVKGHGSDTSEAVIDAVAPRENLLIRPPVANVDRLLIMIAAAVGAAVRKCISDRKNGRRCCGNCSCCDKCTKM